MLGNSSRETLCELLNSCPGKSAKHSNMQISEVRGHVGQGIVGTMQRRVPLSTHSKFVTSAREAHPFWIFFKDCSTVQYTSADDAIKMILKLKRGCFQAKTDVRNAFRILPLRPVEYHLFGFVWNNLYFYDLRYVWGGASSCIGLWRPN